MTPKVLEKNIDVKEKIKPSFNADNTIYITNNVNNKKSSSKSKKALFCTSCDRELDIFWLKELSTNKKSVKNNFEDCQKTGKFKGKYCSKMFISGVYTEKELKSKK